jgi:hypothetical protein
MAANEIPATIKAFLFERIHSHEELEVFVLLGRDPARRWTEAAIADELKIVVGLVSDALKALRNRDMVEARKEDAATYWLVSPACKAPVSELIALYDQQRLEIVMLMSANAIERVRTGAMRTFADCFFLGRKRDDG